MTKRERLAEIIWGDFDLQMEEMCRELGVEGGWGGFKTRLKAWEKAMPKILDEAVKQIRKKGHSLSSSFAIATSALQKSGSLKQGTNKPTKQGVKRGAMTQTQRRKTPP